MNISPHFTWAEVTGSRVAAARNINNALPDYLRPEAEAQAALMERIRAALGAPIIVSSWFRCGALNWAVRRPNAGPGIDNSGDHPRAAATDFTAPGFGTPLEICRLLAPRVDELGVGQLIYEGTWVHVSKNAPFKDINRVITLLPGGAGYAPGIVEV